MTGLDELPIF